MEKAKESTMTKEDGSRGRGSQYGREIKGKERAKEKEKEKGSQTEKQRERM